MGNDEYYLARLKIAAKGSSASLAVEIVFEAGVWGFKND